MVVMRNIFLAILVLMLTSGIAFPQHAAMETGTRAPEIRLPNLRGDMVTLSSQRGKLVLVDFWGTWCAPCVEEQAELARLYGKYRDAIFTNGKGFEIFGVSLDIKKQSWEDFVKTRKINWIQVSDLKFWKSPVAKAYLIQELPFNVLVDYQGTILAKNLHGAELEKAIAGYLKK